MKQICIFRHGETDWNKEGRFQGHLDIPLNPAGRRQARELIHRIDGLGVEAILSSDLSRAYETARIVANSLGLPVFTHVGLREAHLGEAQGLRYDEIERRFGHLLHRWKSNLPTDADISYPGGETGVQVTERVLGAVENFLAVYPFKQVAISTHGGVIRRLMHHVLGQPSETVPIPNGVLYRLAYDPVTRKWDDSLYRKGE